MALAELNTVLDEVFDERGLRDSDAQEYEKMLTEALHRRDHVRICVDGLAIVDDVGHVRQIDVERARVIEATPLPELCEERFREYAAHDPVRLVEIAARPALDSVSLSFLAEALGQAPWPIVGETLLVLLRHRSPLVREGALYGASAHLEHGQVKAALRRIASDFSIPELHAQASEMLDLAFARYSASPADFAALEERRRQKRESRG